MGFLKNLVSGSKARTNDEYDLDLVYLTDRVLLMGWPASGLEAVYRNRMEHVEKFLDAKHSDSYRVFNLCPLSENAYAPTSFHSRISRYPFPDHHPPPLPMIHLATKEMEDWLERKAKNVVVIHCKAGKGRTGLLACCLVERLGGVPNMQKAHGILTGSVSVPGKPEKQDDHAEGEDIEGGSITGPTTLTSTYSEEPTVLSVPLRHPLAPEKKKKHKKGESKYKIPEQEMFEQHPATEIFAFHTSRRMADPNSVRPGVAVPSQRRFVRYFLDSLRYLNTPIDSSKNLPLPSIYPPHPSASVDPPSAPTMLRVLSVQITHAYLGNASTTPKIRSEISRYQDSFVADVESRVEAIAAAAREPEEELAEKMGKLTFFSQRDGGAGGLGIGMSGVGSDEVGGEGQVGEAGAGGRTVKGGGMVRVIGTLREEKVEIGEKDFVGGEATTTPLLTHHLTPTEPLIVHPDREMKVQLLLGEAGESSKLGSKSKGLRSSGKNMLLGDSASSLGWLWLIPSFHLPIDTPSIDSSAPRTHTIVFPRELIDFRSKTMRTVKVVLEEVPAEATSGAVGGGEQGGVKGEVVPREDGRVAAVMLGNEGKGVKGGEHA